MYIPRRNDGRLVGFAMCEYESVDSVNTATSSGDILVGDHAIHISRRKGAETPQPPAKTAPSDSSRGTRTTTPKQTGAEHPPSLQHGSGQRKIGATLYVGNLPYSQSGPSLQMFFDSYECDTICVRVTTDPKTGKSRGFGYADFETREAAEDAMKKLNGIPCQGRKLKLDWTESRKRS